MCGWWMGSTSFQQYFSHKTIVSTVRVVTCTPNHWDGICTNATRHKPGCTTTEDGKRLEFSNLESRGIVLSI